MANSRLVQAGIIIAAFFILVTAFQTFVISFFFIAAEVFGKNSSTGLDFSIRTTLIYFVLFLVALFIQKKSADIAEWIGRRSGTSNQPQVRLSYPAVFSIILVSFSIYQLLGLIPRFGSWVFESFRSKVDRNEFLNMDPPAEIYWPDFLLRLGLYITIIVCARQFGTWLSWSFHETGHLAIAEDADEDNAGTKADQP